MPIDHRIGTDCADAPQVTFVPANPLCNGWGRGKKCDLATKSVSGFIMRDTADRYSQFDRCLMLAFFSLAGGILKKNEFDTIDF